jgi:hypothetical protein
VSVMESVENAEDHAGFVLGGWGIHACILHLVIVP